MWIKLSGALLAAMSMVSLADAGLFSSKMGCGDAKSCGCASTCQPACCKPVIVKPCCPNVYTYQRKCSDIKPPCCDTCCPPASCCAPAACAPACAAPAACAPAATCAPAAAPACAAPAACAPAATCAPAAAPACAAPAACAPAATCAPAAAPACAAPAACAPAACAPACAAPAACAPACAAPAACAPGCAAPCAPTCAVPCAPVCGTTKKGLLSGLFSKVKKADCGSCNTCAAPEPTCAAPVCETRCCDADPCEIAKLIYASQTACYAKDRRAAIHKLGDKFDCICNPEIMTAFIVGLNDCDERVRRKAADEIGDQIRKNCCCCPEVVAALTCSLGDCDKHVVKQATEALELCGYEVVDGCCDPCAATCTTGACGVNGCAPAAAPMHAPAPAPVPPMTTRTNGGLQQLLGLLD